MQSRSARTLQAELHGSSGAKKRRHQDDKRDGLQPAKSIGG